MAKTKLPKNMSGPIEPMGEVDLPHSGKVRVYCNPDKNCVEAVSYGPTEKDPNAGRQVFVNYVEYTATYADDGTPFKPFHCDYRACFVVTHCKTMKEFEEKQLPMVIDCVKKWLERKNGNGKG